MAVQAIGEGDEIVIIYSNNTTERRSRYTGRCIHFENITYPDGEFVEGLNLARDISNRERELYKTQLRQVGYSPEQIEDALATKYPRTPTEKMTLDRIKVT